LSSPNAAGVYALVVDTNAMVAGDITTLRVKAMVLTAGTARVLYEQTFYGVQTDPIKVSLPWSNELTDAGATVATLTQHFGTGRAYPWKILKHA